ncbi:MAG: flagellar protein FlgN [Planctomycetota bacterium]
MEPTRERLTAVLQEHARCHEELLTLEEEKRIAIIANDTERLNRLTLQEDALLAQVERIEEARAAALEGVARKHGLSPQPRLKAVVEALGGAPELLALQERLRKTLLALRHRVAQNAELLRRSVDHFQAFFGLLGEACAPPPVYTKSGARRGEPTRFLDQTA